MKEKKLTEYNIENFILERKNKTLFRNFSRIRRYCFEDKRTKSILFYH